MSRMQPIIIALVASLAAQGAASQEVVVPSTPVADGIRRARGIIERAVAAAGGVEALRGIRTIRRESRVVQSDPNQGMRPIPEEIARPPVLDTVRLVEIADHAAGRFARLTSGTIFGGQPFATRVAISGSSGFIAQDTVRTIVEMSAAGVPGQIEAIRGAWPETILLSALGRPEALRWVGEKRTPSGLMSEIVFADRDGEVVTLEFEQATGLLRAIVTAGTGASRGDQEVRRELWDWRTFPGGVRLPVRQALRRNGVRYTETFVDQLVLNEPVEDQFFARPSDYAPDVRPRREPVRLADGVFVIEGSHSSLLVVFDEFAVVVEPAGSEALTTRTLAAADSLAPGKPIRFVVATHFHGDHLAGVRGFVARGATVLTTPHGAEGVRQVIAAPRRIRPDSLARIALKPSIESVTGRREISDGSQRIELIPAGPSPHVEQIFLVHVPAAGVLYVPDLLDLPAPGVGMAGADTEHLLRLIESRAMDVRIIVPTHGRQGTMDDLRAAVARRSK